MIPQSTKDLARSRPFNGAAKPIEYAEKSRFPLRGADGLTFAERRASRELAA